MRVRGGWVARTDKFESLKDRIRELEKANEEMSSILENAPAAYFRTTLDGRYLRVNAFYARMFGYESREQLFSEVEHIGRATYVEPGDREALMALILEKGELRDHELRRRRRDGSVFWVSMNVRSVLGEDGRVAYLEGFSTDITERKNAGDALAKRLESLTNPSEDAPLAFEDMFDLEKIQLLQDQFAKSAGVASLITTASGEPITRPSNFCELCAEVIRKTEKGLAYCRKSDASLGRLHPEGPVIQPCLSSGIWDAGASICVGGRHVANWLVGQVRTGPPDEERARAYAREIGVDEEVYLDAYRKVPQMSAERFENVSRTVFTLASLLSGSAYQVILQARSINRIRAAEEALRKSEERYALVIKGTNDGVWDWDLRTDEVYFSPRYRQMLGFSEDEPFDGLMEWKTRIHPEDRERVIAANMTCVEGGAESFEVEYRLLHKDGAYRWILGRGGSQRDETGRAVRMTGAHTDITESRRATEDLARIFNLSRDMISMADIRKQEFIRVNPACREILGYSEEELMGRKFSEFVHPDDLEATAAVVRLELETGAPIQDFVNRYRHKNGGYRWLQWASSHCAEEGLVIAVARDVTEARRVEEALRESERRYRKLFTSTIEGVAIHELVFDERGAPADYRIVDVNPRFEEILGISREKAVGALASELYVTSPPPYLAAYSKVAMGGVPFNFETYYAAFGRYFSISVFSPKTNWFATVFQDITESKQAAERLAASVRELENTRALLDAVAQQSPIPMAVADASDGTLRIVNKACREMFGLDDGVADEGKDVALLRKVFRERVQTGESTGEASGDMETPLERALRGERLYGQETRIAGGRGEERWIAAYAAPIHNKQGELIAGYAAFPDITQRKRAEELLVQTEKMMSVGGLAAGMAHEINNPLGIILASVQNVLRRIDPAFPKNRDAAGRLGLDLDLLDAYLADRGVRGFLEGVSDAAQRASRIVRNMLDFSRASESRKAPHLASALLESSLNLARNDYDLKRNYDFRKITIKRRYDPALKPISLTQTEIEQVFFNIVKNAAQAMAEKKYPEGEEPTLTLTAAMEQGGVRVEIADNGPGMDETLRKRAFEPFFTTKAPGSGTGLGLSVSYFIITQNHCGRIEALSTPGQGTRFVIILPAR